MWNITQPIHSWQELGPPKTKKKGGGGEEELGNAPSSWVAYLESGLAGTRC